jgi:hypothetical protein
VVVDAVIDQVSRDEWRYYDRGNTRSVLLESEPILVVLDAWSGIARSDCLRGRHMVVESPAFFQQDRYLPICRSWFVAEKDDIISVVSIVQSFNARRGIVRASRRGKVLKSMAAAALGSPPVFVKVREGPSPLGADTSTSRTDLGGGSPDPYITVF